MNPAEETYKPQPHHEGQKRTSDLLSELGIVGDTSYKHYQEFVYYDFQALDFGFDWSLSQQGYDHWRKMYVSMLEAHFPSKVNIDNYRTYVDGMVFSGRQSTNPQTRVNYENLHKLLTYYEDELASYRRMLSSKLQEIENLKELLD